MLLLEYPLTFLFITLGILAFFLLLFKITNYLEEKKAKSPPKDKKEKEKDTKSSSSSDNKLEEKETIIEDLPGDDKNNYLYDRFVENPTKEDNIQIKSISDTFITEKDLDVIKNSKVYIKVSPVQKINCGCHISNSTHEKIESIINENRSARSKLLQEFDGLSREMKLLLIENIMKKID